VGEARAHLFVQTVWDFSLRRRSVKGHASLARWGILTGKPMDSIDEQTAYDTLISQPALRALGEAHLRIIRAERKMSALLHEKSKSESGFSTSRWTDFGRMVADDEIAWWVRERIDSLDVLKVKAAEAREALQTLLNDAKKLQSRPAPGTFLELVESVCGLCTSDAAQIETLLSFVNWLEESDERGPCILFTYKVWGSTRLAEREFHEPPDLTEEQQLQICTEWATGLRTRYWTTRQHVIMDVSPEIADSIDPETHSGPINVSYESVAPRVAYEVTNRLIIYFEFLRNSCRDLEIEIGKAEQVLGLLDDGSFWQSFIAAVVKSNRTEETWWDLKQTLEMWHAKQPAKRLKELDFCELVAAFANTEGGVFIIGVSDAAPRQIVGLTDIENKVKYLYSAILSNTDISKPAIRVKEVHLQDDAGTVRACLIVGVAKTPNAVYVKDDAGKLSYPIRQGPGKVPSDPTNIGNSKAHQKGYNWEFLDRLRAAPRSG
jgi:hypothetical protein